MNRIIALVILLVPTILGIYVYDDLPEQLAIHFGPSGEPDGFQSKGSFLVVYSLLGIAIVGGLEFFRFIDPKKQNYEKFLRAFSIMRILIALILSVTFCFLLVFNLGIETIGPGVFAKLLVGTMWVLIGNYLPQVRDNYFIGIRTPWTLASEEVWRKTHRFSGPLWVIAGIVMILMVLVPITRSSTWPMFIVLGISVIVPTIYSYIVFRNIGRTNHGA
ncbi:SdpI family protein [Brevibacillus ruminantium]|uniref:SdpI family protein n=1 Tax=Brevibacillus ruminantium TaxID=2950604 RepID=A0ABY4WES5_9BACL|nr:SdpI family protein [Brevibacillus ruminantium]USG64487.1 SdpI family protein [Brevibacillus ruminantium]